MPDGPGRRPGIPAEVKNIKINTFLVFDLKMLQLYLKIYKPCKLLIIETPEEIEAGKECLDCSIEIDVLCRS